MKHQRLNLRNSIYKFLKMISLISVTALAALFILFYDSGDGFKTYETTPSEVVKLEGPTEIIFDVTKPNKLDMKFEVLRRNSYTFSWLFHYYREPMKENSFVRNVKFWLPIKPEPQTEKEKVDAHRVLDLIESIELKELKAANKIQQRATIIPNHFEIFAVGSNGEEGLVWNSEMEKERNDRIGSKQNFGSGGDYHMIHFAGPILEPGIYHFTLNVPKGVKEFVGTRVGVEINGRNSK